MQVQVLICNTSWVRTEKTFDKRGWHFEVRRNGSNFQIFPLEREFRSGTWRQLSPKYTSWKCHPFWPQISIRSFWLACDQNLGTHLERRRNGPNFQIFALEMEFCSGTWRKWSRKYPSWKFLPFLPPHGRKFRFSLFDRRATRTWDPILRCDEMGQIFQIFALEREFRFGTWCQWSRKYPSWKFQPFWLPYSRKFWFGLFDCRTTRTWDRILRCGEMGQISKILPWRENFAAEHDASCLESIPTGNFIHSCRPTVENYDLVVLTSVWVNCGFDRRVTKISVRSFWPLCDHEWSQKGATTDGLTGLFQR